MHLYAHITQSNNRLKISLINEPSATLQQQSFTLTSNISRIWNFAFITSAFDPQTFTCGSENQDKHFMCTTGNVCGNVRQHLFKKTIIK